MLAAYSRLAFLLQERRLSRAELRRRLGALDEPVNVKTLYRLADPDRPLERVDLRVVGAVCRLLGVGLGDLIVFAAPEQARLRRLDQRSQRRLDELMERHGEGALAPGEIEELRVLVDEAEGVARANARQLAEHRRRLRGTQVAGRQATER